MRIAVFHGGTSPPRRLMRGAAAAPSPPSNRGTGAAFTLLELLLVMAMLAIVLSISLPALSGFFRGRNLYAEARRLLSLTRHGQSRSASEGIPMLLWVDAENRSYGLEAEPGWSEEDPRSVEFHLDRELQIEAVQTNAVQKPLTAFELLTRAQPLSPRLDLPQVKFLPDGSVDETSPSVLTLTDRDGAKISVSLSQNRLHYEIASKSQ